jgi:transposase
MIGIDPHKGSHTAFVIDGREKPLGQLRVRASCQQAEALLGWAGRWRQRTWAIEGARGLGNLLAQQLIAAGERVLDVPPKLTARVRLLDSGQINKTDENDARAVAIAALRARELPQLTVEDQTIVMRVWARRYHDLGRLRTQAVCRLHTVLCELVPGGVRTQLRTSQAVAIVDGIVADSPVAQAKLELARDLVADLQRIDAQRREVKRRVARAVAAAPTSITDVYGVGPIVAASVLGYVRDIRRFPSRDRFASYNGTAPIEVSSGDRKVLPALPPRQPPAQPRHPRRRGQPDQSPQQRRLRLLPTQTRQGNDRQVRAARAQTQDQRHPLRTDAPRHTPRKDPGGHSGNDAVSSAAGSHPETPALRTSHSRATANSKTATSDQRPLTSPPAPDKRRTSRSGTGVKLQPRPGPRRGRGQERA